MMTEVATLRNARRAIILAAWRKALNSDAFDPSLSWGDTGADSIATLHLLLELERKVRGRSLTFDSIRPQMTVDDFAALLDDSSTPLLPTAGISRCEVAHIHLFPGLHGDDMRLANFRRAIQPAVGVHLHDLPDLRQPARTLRCVQRSGTAAADAVEKRQPEGPVFLAGFSFGGGVAFEAARALQRKGRRVAFVGLLDTILGDALVRAAPALPVRSQHFKRRLQLACASPDVSRTLLLTLLDRLSPIFAQRLRRYLGGLFREYALRRWQPEPLDVNALLIASEEYGPRTEPMWRRLCSLLEIVRVPNGHVQLFEHPAIGILAPAFENAVTRASCAKEP